jgi:hypothetical protein
MLAYRRDALTTLGEYLTASADGRPCGADQGPAGDGFIST